MRSIALHDSGSHRNDTTLINVKSLEQLPLFKTTFQGTGGYGVLAVLLFQGVMNVCYLAVATHENKRLEGHVVEQFKLSLLVQYRVVIRARKMPGVLSQTSSCYPRRTAKELAN